MYYEHLERLQDYKCLMEIGFHREFFKLSLFTGCTVTFIALYFPVTAIAVVFWGGNRSLLLSTFCCGRF